jgi:hypothetical protein
MAREINLPSSATYIQDFGLNVSPAPIQRNKRVVVIGTAEDGPMYEPIQIEKPEDAEFVWGKIGTGDLVRGIFECWDVQGGHPTVVGVRIGNGKTASLDIEESTGSGADTEHGDTTSLRLEAINPGSVYNGVSISYDENRDVAIYNPKTGTISTFSVDTERPTNPNVDAHNVSELVDAINADPNLNSIVKATYSGLLADYEVCVSGNSIGISNTTQFVEINLGDVIANGYVTTTGYMIPNPIHGIASAANDIINIEAIEAVSISEWEQLNCAGNSVNKFAYMPLDGKSPARWNTIQSLYDYNSDAEYIQDPSGNVVSEYIYNLNSALMNGGAGEGGPTRSGGYFISGSPTNTIRITVPLCIADNEEVVNSGVADAYINGLISTTYASYSGMGRKYAMPSGIATKILDGYAQRPSGKIQIQVALSDDPNDFWQTLPYDGISGIYLSSYVSGVAIFSVGYRAYDDSPIMQSLVSSGNVIRPDVYLRITANTVKGFLTEKENLNALSAGSTLTDYFVRGQEIIFNTPPSFTVQEQNMNLEVM